MAGTPEVDKWYQLHEEYEHQSTDHKIVAYSRDPKKLKAYADEISKDWRLRQGAALEWTPYKDGERAYFGEYRNTVYFYIEPAEAAILD